MKRNVRFAKKIYPKDAIETAMFDFREICSFRLEESEEHIDVEVMPKGGNEEAIYEFSNYVFGVMRQDG
jgi:hypothetical protein